MFFNKLSLITIIEISRTILFLCINLIILGATYTTIFFFYSDLRAINIIFQCSFSVVVMSYYFLLWTYDYSNDNNS